MSLSSHLNLTPKAQFMKGKADKLDLINFCSAKMWVRERNKGQPGRETGQGTNPPEDR
jgi:hypothetical protein